MMDNFEQYISAEGMEQAVQSKRIRDSKKEFKQLIDQLDEAVNAFSDSDLSIHNINAERLKFRNAVDQILDQIGKKTRVLAEHVGAQYDAILNEQKIDATRYLEDTSKDYRDLSTMLDNIVESEVVEVYPHNINPQYSFIECRVKFQNPVEEGVDNADNFGERQVKFALLNREIRSLNNMKDEDRNAKLSRYIKTVLK